MEFPDADIHEMFVVHAVVTTLPHRSFANYFTFQRTGNNMDPNQSLVISSDQFITLLILWGLFGLLVHACPCTDVAELALRGAGEESTSLQRGGTWENGHDSHDSLGQ